MLKIQRFANFFGKNPRDIPEMHFFNGCLSKEILMPNILVPY